MQPPFISEELSSGPGLAEIQENLSFLSLFLGIREITIELDVLVFRTQCLELGFLLFLKTEKKKTATTTKSGVVQVAGGKPSGNLRPVEDRGRDTEMQKSHNKQGGHHEPLRLAPRSSIRPSPQAISSHLLSLPVSYHQRLKSEASERRNSQK